MAKFDVNKYALLGAEARVAELNAELAEIYRAFPALRARGGRTAAGAAAPAGRRRGEPMGAGQRKAGRVRWASMPAAALTRLSASG